MSDHDYDLWADITNVRNQKESRKLLQDLNGTAIT